MLCTACNHSSFSSLRGTCEECGSDTTSREFIFCEQCSADLNACQSCGEDLGDNTPDVVITPGVFMVRKNMADNGSTIKLKLGDELHITLDVSNGYDYTWVDERTHSSQVLSQQQVGGFIPSSNGFGSAKGTQVLVYKASAIGVAQLSLKEDSNLGSRHHHLFGGSMTPSGVTWKATVQVK